MNIIHTQTHMDMDLDTDGHIRIHTQSKASRDWVKHSYILLPSEPGMPVYLPCVCAEKSYWGKTSNWQESCPGLARELSRSQDRNHRTQRFTTTLTPLSETELLP